MHIRPIGPGSTADGAGGLQGKPSDAGRPRRSFAAVLGEQGGIKPEPHRTQATAAPGAGPQAGSGVRALLEHVVGTENRVDVLLRAAARGKTFSPAELLALQASVFRYSQTVEVASRVADRLVGAIKQTVGTSV
jgi:hypothetical protein